MGRRAVLVASAGIALLLFAARPAKLYLPLGSTVPAAGALGHGGPSAAAASAVPRAWPARSNFPPQMTVMDKESVEQLAPKEDGIGREEGLFGRPGTGFKGKKDPYGSDRFKEKRLQEEKMLDALLHLKSKLESELPFLFIQDIDSSYFAEDVVFKEPHLPPIRGRNSYRVFIRGLKDSGNLIFEDPTFSVVRATHHEKDGLVKVRWKISGGYKSPFKFFQSSAGCFDGISYYYIDGSTGLVSVHQVDYTIPILPPLLKDQTALVWLDKAFAGVPSVPACSGVHSYAED
jgi:hypothetical protein